jgi:iodotyrosine deiodinase
MDASHAFMPLQFEKLSPDVGRQKVRQLHASLSQRRSVREFSSEPVPLSLVQECIRVAGTAPSGANMQPWSFVVVSDPGIKHQIRLAAEKEERENYQRRFPKEWLDDLAPFGTDWHKDFLETVPYLIVVFRIDYRLDDSSDQRSFKKKHYYVMESVGIATGLLLAALHTAGLATLTHTPSPMGFLRDILGRRKNETPFVLLPVGYPADEAEVPVLGKKTLDEICVLK